MKKLFFTVVFLQIINCILPTILFAYNTTDSLEALLATADDTNKILILNQLAQALKPDASKKAMEKANKALELSKKQNYSTGIKKALITLANIYSDQGEYDIALKYYEEVLQVYEDVSDSNGAVNIITSIGEVYFSWEKYDEALQKYYKALTIAQEVNSLSQQIISLNGIATCYYVKEEYENALGNYIKASKISEQLGDGESEAQSLLNIGNIFLLQGENAKALKYYLDALKINESLNDKNEVANCQINIGIANEKLAEYDKALEYYQKAFKIKENLGDTKGIAKCLANIGNTYNFLKKYDISIEYYKRALRLYNDISSLGGVVKMQLNIGVIYSKNSKYNLAINYLDKALTGSRAIKNSDIIKRCYEELATAYYATGNYKTAYDYTQKYSVLKDSIYNENKEDILAEMQMKYDTDKKQKEIELLTKDKALKESEINRQHILNIAAGVGLLLVVTLAFFIYRSYRQKQKANHELDSKNQKIESAYKIIAEKNQDITDSINYAKKIQEAILPKIEKVTEVLPDTFILFKPKDIVSGDFYWFYELDESQAMIAAVDCTGHGVPGAFMSMIGSNILNQLAGNAAVPQPSYILESLHEEVRKALKQDIVGSKSNDGMDIALCHINKKTGKLQYAGANRPLYLLRKEELIELKPNKQPIGGKSEEKRLFTNNEIATESGDTIYLFSDGYADQFGGERGKKFMIKRFQQLLKDIQPLEMQQQKAMLHAEIETWKGSLEQIDDILVIGVRL